MEKLTGNAYEKMKADVLEAASGYLQKRGVPYEAQITPARRTNSVYPDSLSLKLKDTKDGVNASPVMPFGDIIEITKEQGFPEGMSFLMDQMCAAMEELEKGDAHVPNEFLNMYSFSPEKLQEMILKNALPVAVNADRNRNLVQDAPHEEADGILCIYKMVSMAGNDLCSVTITDGILERAGLSAEEMKEAAWMNRRALCPCMVTSLGRLCMSWAFPGACSLPEPDLTEADIMAGKKPAASEDAVFGNKPIWCLRHEDFPFAAAVLFDNAFLAALAESFEGDLYIVPSSIHELLFTTDEKTGESLGELIPIVNADEDKVKPDEFLSDDLYLYRRSTGTLEIMGPQLATA